MKTIFQIARMELQKMFYSPIAWLVLIIFGVQAGLYFANGIDGLVRTIALGREVGDLTNSLFSARRGFFNTSLSNIYLYLPLVTMGLLSREFSSGSIKLLYASPVSNAQIVLGKFLSMMLFSLTLTLIMFFQVVYGAFVIKDFDFGLIFTSLLGFYLVLCTYSAIGLFMSSLTSYQIVAAIGTFAVFFILSYSGRMWQDIDFVRDITFWLSINGRAQNIIKGLICSEDILYFILVTGLFLAFTIFRFKGIRENKSKLTGFLRYSGVFVLVALLGYLSMRPSLMKYYDATRTKVNTLTVNSQEIMDKIEGKVKVTTYVNLFGNYFSFGAPSAKNYDLEQFAPYLRFHPNMEFEYKYYYAIPEGRALKNYNSTYKGLTLEEAVDRITISYGVDKDIFKPASYYSDEIDLKSELNRFVRKIELEDGSSVHLRLYDDVGVHPFESRMSAAFKKLTMKLPQVGFVTGHEERSINDLGARGYHKLTMEKPFRHSLLNNGFDFTECSLSKPINETIDILTIADSKTVFSDEELKNLNEYVDRGGNLLIVCDLNRQDIMNPLVRPFGIEFMKGQVVERNEGYDLDLITSELTNENSTLSYHFEEMKEKEQVVSMPGAVGINYEEISNFKYTPVLHSDVMTNSTIDSIGSWNELQTTDFVDDIAQYNAEEGEIKGPLTTGLALNRKVENKEQRIMILGDADFLSNDELSRRRNEIAARNFNMATGIFHWLSNNEIPIDARRTTPPDDEISTQINDISFINLLFKIIIPAILAIGFLLIWLRRKGR
ncbi:Gldg family protein [Flavivirga sp. 57AJ16]|uniref:Gldg family protein n=1 Tax=Flavivirga sp. 57AJ16 TaxID=3025307 RepID=UPI0023651B13|nr:Gldg family protein [Flavivirga sp. 57AJ16]MDD7886258.1 Gldg family protein [Flavivirga sp. 57AJ16]